MTQHQVNLTPRGRWHHRWLITVARVAMALHLPRLAARALRRVRLSVDLYTPGAARPLAHSDFRLATTREGRHLNVEVVQA